MVIHGLLECSRLAEWGKLLGLLSMLEWVTLSLPARFAPHWCTHPGSPGCSQCRAPWQQNVSATTASTWPLDVQKTLEWRRDEIIFLSPVIYLQFWWKNHWPRGLLENALFDDLGHLRSYTYMQTLSHTWDSIRPMHCPLKVQGLLCIQIWEPWLACNLNQGFCIDTLTMFHTHGECIDSVEQHWASTLIPCQFVTRDSHQNLIITYNCKWKNVLNTLHALYSSHCVTSYPSGATCGWYAMVRV